MSLNYLKWRQENEGKSYEEYLQMYEYNTEYRNECSYERMGWIDAYHGKDKHEDVPEKYQFYYLRGQKMFYEKFKEEGL